VLDIHKDMQGVVFEPWPPRRPTPDMVAESATPAAGLRDPSRSLIGFQSDFLTMTRGGGIMHHSFHAMRRSRRPAQRQNGVLVAMEKARPRATRSTTCRTAHDVRPAGIPVYEGMIVGQNSRDNDLVVNPCKKRRCPTCAKSADEAIILTPTAD